VARFSVSARDAGRNRQRLLCGLQANARRPYGCFQDHSSAFGEGTLLEEIAKEGWSEERCNRFATAYEERIRHELAVAFRRLGLGIARSKQDWLGARLTDRRMELLLDTWSDLWIELLGDLVVRFVCAQASGDISASFSVYLRGVIRHLMMRNARSLGLLPKESEAEMLRSLARARTERTTQQWVARLKSVFWHSVVHDVLNQCPAESFEMIYGSIVHVADHFFEMYVPVQVKAIPRRSLSRLVESYMNGPYKEGILYLGHVVPFDPSPRHRVLEGIHSLLGEDEFLSRLSLTHGESRDA